MGYHQYQVVGRAVPTERVPEPKVYRMKIWATNVVRARSKFWFFLKQLCRVQNMYKEYRDTTMNGAVDRLYLDLASRHRARARSIQIIKTAVLKDEECKRESTLQFHGPKEELKFPLTHRVMRPSEKKYRTAFKANRPNVSLF